MPHAHAHAHATCTCHMHMHMHMHMRMCMLHVHVHVHVLTRRRGADTAHTQTGRPTYEAPTHTNAHKHTQTHSTPRTNTHKRTQTHASTNKHTARPDKVRWASHRAPSRLAPPRPQTGKKYNYLQLKAMFRLADLDNSGSIDFNEFLHAQRRVKKESDP